MSWKDRLKEEIVLTSPNGSVFNALWRSGTYSKAKKLGIFNYPKVKGSFVQDLNVNSEKMTSTIYFEGNTNDLEAQLFWVIADEIGKWKIQHPTRGNLDMQLVTIVWNDDPTESGNVTSFNTDWIESIDPSKIKSITELAAEIRAQIEAANAAAAGQYLNLKQRSQAEIQTARNTNKSIVAFAKKALAGLSALSSELNALSNSIQRGINSTLAAVILKPLQIAGQMQQLIQTPALATRSIQSRLSSYENLVNETLGISPDDSTSESFNVSSTQEMALAAVLGAMAETTITGEYQNRGQAIGLAEQLQAMFGRIIDGLDESQELFGYNDIDEQYFSQSEAFSDLARLIDLSIAFALQSSFDLKIEKRFTLTEDKTPIQITIEQYGDIGDNDENFDLFITTNELKGNDILLLPSGREVVVYV